MAAGGELERTLRMLVAAHLGEVEGPSQAVSRTRTAGVTMLTPFDDGANEIRTHDRHFVRIPGLRLHDPLR